MRNSISKNNKNIVVGIFTAIGASLCCITPVLALLGGVSGLATSFSWLDPYRPYFIAATVLIFAYAWYQKLKPAKEVDCNCETATKVSFMQSNKFLGIVTIVAALFIAFPYYSTIFYPKPPQQQVVVAKRSNISTVDLAISGMDCEGCTQHINNELIKVSGVIKANTSYANANAIVTFDSSKVSENSIADAVNNIGYTVTAKTH